MPYLFVAIGLGAGILSGIFGLGGGVVIVPALMLLAKMPPTNATGTSLGALLLPVGALGAWQYYKQGHVDVRASLLISAGLFIGVLLGAKFALGVAPRTVQRAFAAFLVIVAARVWWKA